MKRLTTKDFIERSIKIHGDKYDYSKSIYKNQRSKLIVICKTHGEILQNPSTHMMGYGCPKCACIEMGISKRMKINEFIILSTKIHGNIYEYTKSKYNGQSKKITITCKKHGDFSVLPQNHIRHGLGCNRCNNRIDSTEKFVEKSKFVHNDKYDYSLTRYESTDFKVKIICKYHGVFEQTPHSHLNGRGCPKCGFEKSIKIVQENPKGWNINAWQKTADRSKYFDSFKVYVIKCWNYDEEFYKIGRTFTSVSQRFRCKNFMPYRYEVLHEFIFNTAKEAFDKETELKRQYKEFKYTPKIKFDGMHECFSKLSF